MQLAIDLPEDIAVILQQECPNVARLVLESLALEGYRSRKLTVEEVRRLLGFETRFEVHDFLGEHGVPFYTLDELEHDRQTSHRLGL